MTEPYEQLGANLSPQQKLFFHQEYVKENRSPSTALVLALLLRWVGRSPLLPSPVGLGHSLRLVQLDIHSTFGGAGGMLSYQEAHGELQQRTRTTDNTEDEYYFH